MIINLSVIITNTVETIEIKSYRDPVLCELLALGSVAAGCDDVEAHVMQPSAQIPTNEPSGAKDNR